MKRNVYILGAILAGLALVQFTPATGANLQTTQIVTLQKQVKALQGIVSDLQSQIGSSANDIYQLQGESLANQQTSSGLASTADKLVIDSLAMHKTLTGLQTFTSQFDGYAPARISFTTLDSSIACGDSVFIESLSGSNSGLRLCSLRVIGSQNIK